MMRTSQRVRTLGLAVALCVAAPFAGCGRKESAPLLEGGENSAATPGAKPVEAALEQQTEQKLDLLTKEDVELYLKVMREAAERVKNHVPADQAALERGRKIIAGGATGRVPTQDDVKTLERATLVALSMDQIVAEDMKLDGRTYRGIAEAVESAVGDPARAVTSSKGGPPVPDRAPTLLQERLKTVNAANEKFLAPYRTEIQGLIPVVRNPANLPK